MLGIYTLSGLIQVREYDVDTRTERVIADIGTYDADGGAWQDAVDAALVSAGYRRVGPWRERHDDAAVCRVTRDN